MAKSDKEQKAEFDQILKNLSQPKINYTSVKFDNAPMDSDTILELNRWYRNVSKWLFFIIIAFAFVLLVMTYAILNLGLRPPITLGYAIDSEGRVVVLQEKNVSELTDGEVLTWAGEKASQIHKLAYVDADRHVEALKKFFTRNAYLNYQRALLASSIWEAVVVRENISYAKHRLAPKIIDGGYADGWWKIEMKLDLHIGKAPPMPVTAIMTVITDTELTGVVIDGYLVKEN